MSSDQDRTHAEASALRGPSHAVVYWRPGCPYCQDLMAGLSPDDERISLVNIWEDAEAAAFVRSVQDGNELVPTVVVGEQVLTAPSSRQVIDALA
ncbi:glutaredoxin domain-containing protein [Luteococcus sp. Sow4_B9]|uniref:glutaredoxin domain-containing protein n=1 Tax=Luteococcus sp. Sow4_B9 TaxID=3438792 RepID=UPI003F96FDDE